MRRTLVVSLTALALPGVSPALPHAAMAAAPTGVVTTNAVGSSVEPLSLVLTGDGSGLRARLRIRCGGAPGERDTWTVHGTVVSSLPTVVYSTDPVDPAGGDPSRVTGRCTGREQVVVVPLVRSADTGAAAGSVFTLFELGVGPCLVDPVTGALPATCTTLPVGTGVQMEVLNRG